MRMIRVTNALMVNLFLMGFVTLLEQVPVAKMEV